MEPSSQTRRAALAADCCAYWESFCKSHKYVRAVLLGRTALFCIVAFRKSDMLSFLEREDGK